MKEIVVNAEKLISILDVSNHAKVGIQWEHGTKCMIIQTSYGFIGVDGSLDTNNAWSKGSIQEYIEQGLRQKGTRAFYFNKSSELFEWMSK